MGRPPLADRPEDTRKTTVRLEAAVRARIEAIVGPNGMAEFVRAAVEAELRRRERARERSGE